MKDRNGGEPERLAPVIPLFAGSAAPADAAPRGDRPVARPLADPASAEPVKRGVDAEDWRSTWDAPSGTAGGSPGVGQDAVGTPSERHPARGARTAPQRRAPKLRALRPQAAGHGDGFDDENASIAAPEPAEVLGTAEELLVRKLRTRSLSVSEARLVLRGHELQGAKLPGDQIDDIIDDFCRRGYLDDAILAGHLVTSGVERKGQGRVALSRALAQRGIPRDVIDSALDELPDDDAERALEFARTKARALSRLDGDTALRRLVGQLARRGYNGSVAMTAAKTALAETSSGGYAPGVRFVDSD